MSQVKLNPYVDLGLSSDPGQVQGSQPSPTDNSVVPSAASPSFGGITDLSTYGKPEPSTTVTQTPNLYTQVNPSDLQKDEIKVISTVASTETGSNNLFFILAIILFFASIGALIFFVLRYMGLI